MAVGNVYEHAPEVCLSSQSLLASANTGRDEPNRISRDVLNETLRRCSHRTAL